MSKQNIIRHSTHYLLFLLLLIGLPGKLQAQSAVDSSKTEAQSQPDSTPASQPTSILSIEGGKKLMMEADRAIESQQYDLAVEKLQSARQVYNQLSNFYLQLFNSFTGLDNAAAESHRKKALDTSLERDRATYQLALVHRSQNKPELSVPLLIQIITSQSPGIGLGRKAYEQLLEIGFVDIPYTPPQPGAVPSNPPVAPPAPNSPPESQAPSPEAAPVAPTP
ncbi:MAG: hypothetical protein RLZZ381_1172 [Cyanobacteriota bacterium]|jgi:hypothetical protein